jgi:hypothetical protein
LIYAPMPVPDDADSGSSSGRLEATDVASGCDGGAMTIRGAALAAVFGIGAVSVAALASMPPLAPRAPREELA